jgi:hypothetical protein
MPPAPPDEPIVVEYISAKRYRRVSVAAYGIGGRVVRSGLPVTRQRQVGAAAFVVVRPAVRVNGSPVTRTRAVTTASIPLPVLLEVDGRPVTRRRRVRTAVHQLVAPDAEYTECEPVARTRVVADAPFAVLGTVKTSGEPMQRRRRVHMVAASVRWPTTKQTADIWRDIREPDSTGKWPKPLGMVILSGQGLGALGNFLVPWRPGMPWRGFAVARAPAGSTTVDTRLEGVVQLDVAGVFSPAQNGRVVYALDDARYSLTPQDGAVPIGRVLLHEGGRRARVGFRASPDASN